MIGNPIGKHKVFGNPVDWIRDPVGKTYIGFGIPRVGFGNLLIGFGIRKETFVPPKGQHHRISRHGDVELSSTKLSDAS